MHKSNISNFNIVCECNGFKQLILMDIESCLLPAEIYRHNSNAWQSHDGMLQWLQATRSVKGTCSVEPEAVSSRVSSAHSTPQVSCSDEGYSYTCLSAYLIGNTTILDSVANWIVE